MPPRKKVIKDTIETEEDSMIPKRLVRSPTHFTDYLTSPAITRTIRNDNLSPAIWTKK